MEHELNKHLDLFADPAERIGAWFIPGEGTHVRIWAPIARTVSIEWDDGSEPSALVKVAEDFIGLFPDKAPGNRYRFIVDGERIPDPASRYQPEDVYGPSEVVDTRFDWADEDWRGVPYDQWVIYELHVGTFSERGDFQGVIDGLPRLKELGVNVLEIMPVGQWSGDHNWGYDVVFPHAVQHTYGGPAEFKRLVNEAHKLGLSVILDIVYNHLGPEGGVTDVGTVFFDRNKRSDWGEIINFTDKHSDGVRRYFLQNMWQWMEEFHMDGFRVDAVQAILDNTAMTFMEEMAVLAARMAEKYKRPIPLIAESDRNDPRLITPQDRYGVGFHAMWSDDFHGVLHVALTGEHAGYYGDYTGGLEQLARVYRRGIAYEGQYAPTKRRRQGRPFESVNKQQFVVCIQNHDQVGNRLGGERIPVLVGLEGAKLGIAAVLLSPFTPMLFMGEEWAATEPFYYFIDYADPDLLAETQKGREVQWGDFPAPHPVPGVAETITFTGSRFKKNENSDQMEAYYKVLIRYSLELRGLNPYVDVRDQVLTLHYPTLEKGELAVQLNFSRESRPQAPLPPGEWDFELDSASFPDASLQQARGLNVLAPLSATVYRKKI